MKTFINSNEVNIGQELFNLIELNESPILNVSQTTIEAMDLNLDKTDPDRKYLLRFSNNFGSFGIGHLSKNEIKKISHWTMGHNQTLSLMPINS